MQILGGGAQWTGDRICVDGYHCSYETVYFSQCVPESGMRPRTAFCAKASIRIIFPDGCPQQIPSIKL